MDSVRKIESLTNEKWQIIPSPQFFYEYTKRETYSGEIFSEHEMNNTLLGPGMGAFYKNLSLNMAYQIPVYDAQTEHPYSAGTMVIALSYNINQSKYLLNLKSSLLKIRMPFSFMFYTRARRPINTVTWGVVIKIFPN